MRLLSLLLKGPAGNCSGGKESDRIHRLYLCALKFSRESYFYRDLGVPDTFDGRFELLALFNVLLSGRFQRAEQKDGQGKAHAQRLFDQMFRHVEDTLREMGIGDLSVPRHMKRMMTAYNGRLQVYLNALDPDCFPLSREVSGKSDVSGKSAGSSPGNAAGALAESLRRNVYGTEESVDEHSLEKLAIITKNIWTSLQDRDIDRIIDGDVSDIFTAPENMAACRNVKTG